MWGRRAALPVVFLTFLGACGEEPVPTGNIVTPKEDYIREADDLCLEYQDARASIELAYRDASPAEQAKARRRLAATTGEKVQDKLEALPQPETEDQELLGPIFELMRKQVDAVRAGKQADTPPRLDRLADRYGFDTCGQR